jgi:hypothetical protein
VLNAWIQVQLADGAAAAKPAPRITMRCVSLSAVGSPEEGFMHRFIGREWVGGIAGVYETSGAAVP